MAGRSRQPLGLYLHFPFCLRKCRYCDFLSFSADERAREAYLERLIEEIAVKGPQYDRYEIKTLFIGGGTPSLMSGRLMDRLMDAIFRHFHVEKSAEMTVECNPGTTDAGKLDAYRRAGLNRISFGLQSMNEAELKYLGRIHTAEQFLENYEAARRCGFENINIDLMSALPGQSVTSYLASLRQVIGLSPEHISAYSLIIEEGTPFWQLYGEPSEGYCDGPGFVKIPVLPLPDEDSEREMYHRTREELAKNGYGQYEISNYARAGFECGHNLTYWYRGDYLGLGLGAASMVGNIRFSNTRDLQKYMTQFAYEEKECLDVQAQMEETMFLGLRCIKGIRLSEFRQQFGQDVMAIYGEVINKYCRQGMMCMNTEKDRLYLTDQGRDVSNWILADFLL